MKSFMSWSGGKDSALALYYATKQNIRVQALLTSVNQAHERISMHGVRRTLLEEQVKSLQLPLHTLELSEQPNMNEYEEAVNTCYASLKKEGFNQAIFGDIFLEDLKIYREAQLARHQIQSVFPIWKRDTNELIHEFISLGFKAVIVCVNTKFLDRNFCGRLIDEEFVNDLPADVDPCGENGEYHSFVFDGPLLKSPVQFMKGETVYKEYRAPVDESEDCFSTAQPATGFYFIDLLPV
ncbi:MAG: diphthine--ammonia ligase [Bacteroidota bacterium]|nr:diphthine--ammonia ligase [Bacteroidota bacterium]